MKNLRDLIRKIGEISESSERIASETGETELYKVFRRKNLNTLKKLAPRYYSVLAEAFNTAEDHRVRALLCECLQYANARELEPLFENLLNQDNSELRCCAMVALGRLGNISALARIYRRTLQSGDRPTRFFLGCAFIHARDKRGITLLVSVLREEQSFVSFTDGYVTTSSSDFIYSPTIDIVLNSLVHSELDPSENPFKWITWWESHGDEVESIDPAKVPAYLCEYYSHDMIGELYKKRSH